MGVKIGEIDIAQQTLDSEFGLGVLERLVERIINTNQDLDLPDQNQLLETREEVIQKLQKKYPNSGIELKKEE